jgi:ubiquinone/menaquinone biosynthesis C-methylase UbiE
VAEDVKRYFERQAGQFDSIYREDDPIWTAINRRLRRAVYDRFAFTLAECADLSGKTVLDVGCGSGRYFPEYCRLGARRVVGIDLSGPMLELGQVLIRREGIADRCRLVQGDFLELPFEGRFDVVVAMGVFDYQPEPDRALAAMVRASRGKVLASFPAPSPVRGRLRQLRYRARGCDVYYYTEQDVRELVARSGLSDYHLVSVAHSGGAYLLSARAPTPPATLPVSRVAPLPAREGGDSARAVDGQ